MSLGPLFAAWSYARVLGGSHASEPSQVACAIEFQGMAEAQERMDKCRAELLREVAMATEAGKRAVARRAGVGAAPHDFEEMLTRAAAAGS